MSAINPVTFDELNTLKGINTQTTIQAQLDSKDTDSLTTNYILVGDAGGLSASVPMSGGGTIVSSGLLTLGTNTSYATTATAATTTTLIAASAALQYFTGVTTQTVVLPVVTTLALGWKVRIVNLSTGAVTVNSSGGNLVATVGAGLAADITCILITGTTAASWSAFVFSNVGFANPMTTLGDIIYGGASGVATRLPTGTLGQSLITQGAGAPIYARAYGTWVNTLTYTCDADSQTIGNGSYATISGMTSQNITLEAGTYGFEIGYDGYASPTTIGAVQASAYVDTTTDFATPGAVITGGSPFVNKRYVGWATTTGALTAGSHAIIPRFKGNTTTGKMDTGYTCQIAIFKLSA